MVGPIPAPHPIRPSRGGSVRLVAARRRLRNDAPDDGRHRTAAHGRPTARTPEVHCERSNLRPLPSRPPSEDTRSQPGTAIAARARTIRQASRAGVGVVLLRRLRSWPVREDYHRGVERRRGPVGDREQGAGGDPVARSTPWQEVPRGRTRRAVERNRLANRPEAVVTSNPHALRGAHHGYPRRPQW